MKKTYVLSILYLTFFFFSAHSQSWKKQAFSPSHFLRDVHFKDSIVGFAAGANANIYKSTDGGVTWKFIGKSNLLYQINDIHFSKNSGTYGWATGPGSSANIYLTVDGGETWSPLNIGFTIGTTLNGVHIAEITPNGNINGWCVGFRNNLSWIARENSPENKFSKVVTILNSPKLELNAIHSTSYQNAVSVGMSGIILHSGSSQSDPWYQLNSVTSQNLRDVFLLGTKGWIVGDGGTLLKSMDSGSSWSKTDIQVNGEIITQDLHGVFFTDPLKGWIVGNGGTILHTKDGGDTWAQESSGTTANLYGLHFINATTGWAVGDNGTILKYNASGQNSLNLSSTDTNPCQGDTITLKATVSIQNPEWTRPNGSKVYAAELKISNIQPSDSGLYLLNGIWNGNPASGDITIEVFPQPTFSAPGAQLSCDGKPVTLTASASSSYQYAWTGPNLPLTNGGSVSVTTAGTYSVTATNPSSGCSSSKMVTVTAPSNAPKAFITSPNGMQLTCALTQLVLQGSSDKPNTTYAWKRNGQPFSQVKSPIINQAGQYELVVTDIVTACTGSTSVTITESKTPPTIQWLTQETAITCIDKLAVLQASATPSGASFSWQGPGVTGATGAQLTTDKPGTYLLTVTGTNGCSSVTSVQVTIDTITPRITGIQTVWSDCTKDEYGLEATGLPLNAQFQWYDQSGLPLGQGSQIVVQGSGIYTLRLVSPNGCQTEAQHEIRAIQNQDPPTIITPNGDGKNDRLVLAFCGSQGIPLSLTVYNRWGQVVYRSDDYRDDWPLGSAEDLSAGQYYYLIKYQDHESKHPLTILKE